MRAYDLLLRLLPSSFRHEYAPEMRADFARRSRDAGSARARAGLWLDAIADVASTAAGVHADVLRQDIRYAVRSLWRSPSFALTAIVVTALGIGATTAAFSTLDYVMFRPLPFARPDRLVKLWQDQSSRGYSRMELSPGNFRDWKQGSRSFAGMAAYTGISGNLIEQGDPERLEGAAVTPDLFEVLGVQAALGRTFESRDVSAGAASEVLLGDALWRGRFGASPGVLGRKIVIDGEPRVVVGVLPRDFAFPSRDAEFWLPLRFAPDDYEDRTNTYLRSVGRLQEGATIAQARAELGAVAADLERRFPKENARTGATVVTFRDEVPYQSRSLLLALAGASAAVLLIACTNLASLLLTRALSRQRELSVRSAIGAGPRRLIRQMLTESAVLATAGGVLGVGFAAAAMPLIARLVPNALPIAETPAADGRMLLVAALATIATAIGFGLVPAVRTATIADASGLQDGVRAGASRHTGRLKAALVVSEVACTIALLVAAGLLLRALWRVERVDPGFRAEGVLTMRTTLPLPKYGPTARRVQFYHDVLSEVRQLPGVTDAAYISFLPMVMGGGIWPVIMTPGQNPADSLAASLRFVTPGFFAAAGVPVRRGRDITEADAQNAPAVAVVSASFAEQYWPGEDAIGKRFTFALQERTVVGVAGNVRVRGLERVSEPQVYASYQQVPDDSLVFYIPKDLLIRTTSATGSLVPAVRRIVARADPQQPISDVRLLSDIVAANTSARTVQVTVLGGFAALAFGLAAVGIHGLLAFGVSQRLREIAVRLALGATTRDILRLVVSDGLRLGLLGVVFGLPLAYVVARALATLLAGLSPADPISFAAATAITVIMTILGSVVPALRAVRVEAAAAMKME